MGSEVTSLNHALSLFIKPALTAATEEVVKEGERVIQEGLIRAAEKGRQQLKDSLAKWAVKIEASTSLTMNEQEITLRIRLPDELFRLGAEESKQAIIRALFGK